ncbi:MAG: type III-A CRISPR-associated protein Csm2 [Bacteroidota bacterium]
MADKPQKAVKSNHFSKDELKQLVNLKLKEIDGSDTTKVKELNNSINKLEGFVESNANGITPSQLRNIFNNIKEMSESELGRLVMLRPKLAYILARQDNLLRDYKDKQKGRILIEFFDKLIQQVHDQSQFSNFKMIMEAVVAYHKRHYTGKNK